WPRRWRGCCGIRRFSPPCRPPPGRGRPNGSISTACSTAGGRSSPPPHRPARRPASGFLFCTDPRPPGEPQRLLERFLFAVTASVREAHGPWGSLAVAACDHDVEPVVASEQGLTVLLGWPVLHAPARFRSAPVLDSPRRH